MAPKLEATADEIARGVRVARERIAAAAGRVGRDPNQVRILAATKYVDAAGVQALVEAGVDVLGENRVDSLIEKHAVAPGATWHFIGRMQSRQVADVAPLVSCIETVCSASALKRLTILVEGGDHPIPSILLQVNVAEDPAKDGLQPGEVHGFIESIPDGINVAGLMTMPAFAEDPEASRASFAALRELLEQLHRVWSGAHTLTELSMGTSQDHLVAVEEGATLVRLGRVLFAPGEL